MARRFKLFAVSALLAFVLVPYVQSRVLAPGRAVRIRALHDTSARAEVGPGHSLTICTYNIAHGRGQSDSNFTGEEHLARRERLLQIAAFLKSTEADVVVLNEVDFCTLWSGHENQAEEIARAAGFPHWAEQTNLDFAVGCWSWRFGNVLLSRYPILEARRIELPAHSTWERSVAGCKRGLWCTLDIGGESWGVVAVHLEHRDEGTRVRAAAFIAEVARHADVPVLLAGDLNSVLPDDPRGPRDGLGRTALGELLAAERFGRLECPGQEATFPAINPNRAIDWILPPRGFQVRAYEVPAVYYSDHRPVVATVQRNPLQAE